MCGITGMLGNADRETALAMATCLSHRGPNGGGGFYDELEHGAVAFGHARLSIVDIEGSSQPIGSDHGAVLVQNGEIYNHSELRSRCNTYPWRTSGDSEAVLAVHRNAMIAAGSSSHDSPVNHARWVSLLDGIWGFALWDPVRRELLLSRDTLGVKPLLRTLLPDGTLLFASEVKAFHAHPEFIAQPDINALAVRLAYEYPMDMTTLFLDVTQVAPGTIESWSLDDDGRAVLNRVSRYSRDIVSPAEHWDPSVEARILLDSFRDGLENRMMSDVPIGIVLSGGLDSGLVAALAHQVSQSSGKSVPECWTVASSEDNPDFVASKMITQHLDLGHHTKIIEEDAFWKGLPRFVASGEDLDITVLFWQTLFEDMSKQVTVGLCGQGADELHAGYARYRDLNEHSRLVSNRLSLAGGFDISGIEHGPGRPWLNTKIDPEHHYKDLSTTLQFELERGQLSNFQLRLADRHSMAQGMEVRVPFLSSQHRTVSNRLPLGWRLAADTEKLALREAASLTDLPDFIVRRPKLPAGTATAPDLVSSLIQELTPHATEWAKGYGRLSGQLADQPEMAIGMRMFHSIHLTGNPQQRANKPMMELLEDVSDWPE
ncbi:MAG: asparagine synthase (glutamine-hydrolyzing) [Candidatus Thalassarchaeum sp.]|nr:asparagine synthase (glutamine-hydrolyzing) [Candidatus Thalassarchaeum sp.]